MAAVCNVQHVLAAVLRVSARRARARGVASLLSHPRIPLWKRSALPMQWCEKLHSAVRHCRSLRCLTLTFIAVIQGLSVLLLW